MNRETESFALPSGATIEVEILPDKIRGARDAAVVGDVPARLEEALAPLKETVDLVLGQLRSLRESVDSVTIEMGASFKGGARLVLVQGEIASTLKITVGWKRRKQPE